MGNGIGVCELPFSVFRITSKVASFYSSTSLVDDCDTAEFGPSNAPVWVRGRVLASASGALSDLAGRGLGGRVLVTADTTEIVETGLKAKIGLGLVWRMKQVVVHFDGSFSFLSWLRIRDLADQFGAKSREWPSEGGI